MSTLCIMVFILATVNILGFVYLGKYLNELNDWMFVIAQDFMDDPKEESDG